MMMMMMMMMMRKPVRTVAELPSGRPVSAVPQERRDLCLIGSEPFELLHYLLHITTQCMTATTRRRY